MIRHTPAACRHRWCLGFHLTFESALPEARLHPTETHHQCPSPSSLHLASLPVQLLSIHTNSQPDPVRIESHRTSAKSGVHRTTVATRSKTRATLDKYNFRRETLPPKYQLSGQKQPSLRRPGR